MLRAQDLSIGELLNGQVHLREWTPHHMTVYDILSIKLGYRPDLLVPRHGWMFDYRAEIHVGEQVIVPDFAGWRANRRIQPSWDEPYCGRLARRYNDVPDWIADVIEPTHVGLVRNIKLPVYLGLGVRNVWLINRIKKAVEVYSATATSWQLDATFSGNGRLHADPLKRFAIELSDLWQPE